jgi:3D (Asp-Asp-Asp) domain-containing protein
VKAVGRPAASMLMAALLSAVLVAASSCSRDRAPLRYPPVVVMSAFRLDGAVVEGARKAWWKLATQPVRYGDPLPVRVTMYCLQGTTRRGRYVRGGIVAADPRFFPLSRYIELYVGRKYAGRFLVDDTGKRILGARIDVWTDSCREARRFGINPGTAVLIQRPAAAEIRLAGEPRKAK